MSNVFTIISPLNGDMLHAADSVEEHGEHKYKVSVLAHKDAVITVNGLAAKYADGIFTAFIFLEHYKNTVEVKEEISNETKTITVFRLKHFAGKYRLSIDDNIWFLQDIHKNEQRYTSIFDNPYLGFLKKMHD